MQGYKCKLQVVALMAWELDRERRQADGRGFSGPKNDGGYGFKFEVFFLIFKRCIKIWIF